MVERAKITIKGVVQGVGFRPYVYALAGSLKMRGYVTNTSEGVSIDIEGEKLDDFIARLPQEAPELSIIFEVTVVPLPVCGYADFRILESSDEGRFTLISHDVSVCDDCLRELIDPADRRYLYPFINCTNCGPRFSITRSVPYDRPNTTMSGFTMCPACRAEYEDPANRRFHAQPNACPECGPQIHFKVHSSKFKVPENENALKGAITLLRGGGIVAIKGIGGFHIACDAANDEAVKRLRDRKRKSNKPFALMAPDTGTVETFCEVSEEERNILLSRRRPIVLLRKRNAAKEFLSEAVSPRNPYLGFMLPYTPLHYLLFYHPLTESITNDKSSHFSALVMTSGNLSEEPIVKDNDEAEERLSDLADAFLFHNRDIFMRVDDSVVRVTSKELSATADPRQAGRVKRCESNSPMLRFDEVRGSNSSLITRHSSLSFIRRSRGYVPEPIPLHDDGPDVMGCGADLKNTFTLTKGGFAIPSQHIGDLENYETLRFFEESLENLRSVYRVEPVAIAHDLHPGYLSTRWAVNRGAKGTGKGAGIFGIQHHYAHIGSVMAERNLSGKVIGVVFDGTGYGTDGNLWGGEFLVADIHGFERVGRFRYVPLPGGETAIREPWRTAVSYIADVAGNQAPRYLSAVGFTGRYGRDTMERIVKLIPLRDFSPLSSGAGRLFDAVSAMLGICDRNTFEGEAAIALESLVKQGIDEEYPFDVGSESVKKDVLEVDFSLTVLGIMEDFLRGVDISIISTKFHNTVCGAVVRVAREISRTYGLRDVVLSGGTFQNLYLLQRISEKLTREDLAVFINEKVPCNDAGISLGQAYICRERLRLRNREERLVRERNERDA